MTNRLDWEGANRREAAAPEFAVRPVVAWWLTLPRFASRCDHCGGWCAAGEPAAYSHAERLWRCRGCAESTGLVLEPSKRLLVRARRRNRRAQGKS